MMERIVRHTQAQTTAYYAHLADDLLQSLLDRVGSSIKKAPWIDRKMLVHRVRRYHIETVHDQRRPRMQPDKEDGAA